MDVEHLWHYNEAELSRLNQPPPLNQSSSVATNPLLASAGLSQSEDNPDLIANLCNVADHRLYKIVKWCKSLPLFKNISVSECFVFKTSFDTRIIKFHVSLLI